MNQINNQNEKDKIGGISEKVVDQLSVESGRKRKKTHNQYIQEVQQLVGNEYTVLGKYVDAKHKIKFRHNVCGYEYEIIPSAFTSKGNRCPKCAQKLKGRTIKDPSTFLNEVNRQVGDEYSILSEYKGSKEKVKVRHNICGNVWEVFPQLFLAGTRCPLCAKKKMTKSTEQYKAEVFKYLGMEYSILGEYINARSKILVRHNKCGYEWSVRAQSLLGQTRCPLCFGKVKKTQEQFEEEVRQLGENEYEVIGTYINNRTKIEIKHKKCGYIYEVLPSAFLQGKRCPKCARNK